MVSPLPHTSYSILELAGVAAGATPADTFRNSLDLARHAERWGYQRFWLAEHHNSVSIASSAPPVLIGHIAGGTQTIRVGSGGVMLPNHAPLVVAEQFGTLGHLYPGRIDMGLGRAPGTDQATAHAIRPARMQSVHAFPDEIRQIQQYFSADNEGAAVRANVAEGLDVPIYILGSSTDSAHLAAAMGLPYAFASHFAPAQLSAALAIYRDEFRPSAVLKEPYVIVAANIIAADTDADAERIATTLLKLFLGILTGKRDYMQPPETPSPELREAWQHPAFQQMLQYSFVGGKDSVRQQTEQFLRSTGADEIMAVGHIFHHEDRLRSFELFAEIMSGGR